MGNKSYSTRSSLHQLFSICMILSFTSGQNTSDIVCRAPGKFPTSDPTRYQECHLVGENRFTLFFQECPPDTCFNADAKGCNVNYCERRQEGVPSLPTFTCPSAGKFSHVDSSRIGSFYKCIEIQGKLFMYEYQCLPAKPCFSYKRQMCQRC